MIKFTDSTVCLFSITTDFNTFVDIYITQHAFISCPDTCFCRVCVSNGHGKLVSQYVDTAVGGSIRPIPIRVLQGDRRRTSHTFCVATAAFE